MGNAPFKAGMPEFSGNAAVLQNTGHHLRACLPLVREARLAAADPILERNTGDHPENIRLVRIPKDLRKTPRPGVQALRKIELVMQADHRLRHCSPVLRKSCRGEPVNEPVHKQDIRAELRVIHRLGIHKGAEAARLFKSPDVMQQAEKPRAVRVFSAHPERLCVPLRQLRHTEGMLNLMADQNILCIVLLRITEKYRLRRFFVIHRSSPDFIISVWIISNCGRQNKDSFGS